MSHIRLGRLAARLFSSRWMGRLMILLFLLAVLAFVLVAKEIELLEHFRTYTAAQDLLDLEEVLALTAICVGGLLLFALRRVILQKREIKRREAAENYALNLACHDPLTGLPNRRHFMDAVDRAMTELPHGEHVHAVMLMDLNSFKAINDIYGHPIGDELLIELGGMLSAAAGNDGMVARLGGDEFALMARDLASPDEAARLGRRLLAVLEKPIRTARGEHRLGLGIGIALAPRDGTERAELVRKADVALYRAKAEGSSSLSFFEQEMEAHLRERSYVEQELRTALDLKSIAPAFQPSLDLETGQVTGFDVVPHWSHAILGVMSPKRYVSVAEDSGLIRDLTEQVLRQACFQAATWPSELTLSFRLADALMRDPGLSARVLKIVSDTRLDPARLEIAVSEGAVMRDVDESRKVLTPLRQAGVKLALANFGTSYASIWHLRDLQFDKLKIDRSFIEDLDHNPNSAVVVRTILGLGRGLGLAISADGIEKPEQRDLLHDQGLEEGQGRLFGRTLTGEEAIALVSRQALGQMPR
ncbi:putative bifunctional diguanylate cyclase/phosphodiesterase [Terrihabitans sp. B22-R8]|uniref:putative bifunctional diguanylate cyclase/phosphodiesterase n=1 Tax=Terrihabitans sp. B22-R8 TaxID=3425128 RepID=UPI00403C09F4